ncbi:MAG: phosphoribosylanthranilate isomerase [Candidatus Micrarchaeota archaeon]
MVKIKICGLTNESDARVACRLGANFIGVVVSPESSRKVTNEQAISILKTKTPFISSVVVTSSTRLTDIEDIVCNIAPDLIQLHGDIHPSLLERLEFHGKLIKTIPICEGVDYAKYFKGYGHLVSSFLLDTKAGNRLGGTGIVGDWDLSAKIVKESPKPVFLAGGLTPENVFEAVKKVKPYSLDICTGVEEKIGKKSEEKMRKLIELSRP